MSKKEVVVGCFEPVSFPELGGATIMAKVDTGAFSGALHCTGIKVVRRGVMRKRILKFTPLDNGGKEQETDTFFSTYVRSATGHRARRYVIDTSIEIQGKIYPVRIGLADRSEMKSPALIGRRFLRENNIIVDVRRNAEYDDEGENTK